MKYSFAEKSDAQKSILMSTSSSLKVLGVYWTFSRAYAFPATSFLTPYPVKTSGIDIVLLPRGSRQRSSSAMRSRWILLTDRVLVERKRRSTFFSRRQNFRVGKLTFFAGFLASSVDSCFNRTPHNRTAKILKKVPFPLFARSSSRAIEATYGSCRVC